MKKKSELVVSSVLAGCVAIAALYPTLRDWRHRDRLEQRLSALEQRVSNHEEKRYEAAPLLSLRVRWLGPLLASWQTVGGCGAGTSGGAGVAIKWIGRGTSGGLFQTQIIGSYLHLDPGANFNGGYNLAVTAQVTRDITDKWNFGVLVPYLYKYYRDYYQLPVDVSNAGVGDVNLLLTRRLGPINATSLTLSVGLPTGVHDARYKNDLLTQEKQLGLGRLTAGLLLDHTIDETWGIIVLGGSLAYRGGENELGNYRAPAGALWGYAGYFLGPFVPSLGLTVTQFAKHDRDRTLEQDVPLTTLAGSASLEWSSDYLAILVGASFPYSVPKFDAQPWIAGLGVTFSPF